MARSLACFVWAFCLTLPASSCGSAARQTTSESADLPPMRPVSTTTAHPEIAHAGPALPARPKYAVGQPVLIEFQGAWFPGRIRLVMPDGRYEISYDGYGPQWHQLVSRERLRTPGSRTGAPTPPAVGGNEPPGRALASLSELDRGSLVWVEYQGTWYFGRVLRVAGRGARIHYSGYGHEWDEMVGTHRLRIPTHGPPPLRRRGAPSPDLPEHPARETRRASRAN